MYLKHQCLVVSKNKVCLVEEVQQEVYFGKMIKKLRIVVNLLDFHYLEGQE